MRPKILQLYVLRELATVFALSVLVNVAVVCFALLVTFVMRNNPSLALLGEALPWLAVQGLFIVLPFAFLISVTLVYGRLSRDNEVLALEASGTSVYFLVGPGLLLCLVVVFTNLLLNDYVVPRARWQLHKIIARNAPELLLKQLPTRTEFDNLDWLYLTYEKYDTSREMLINARFRSYDEAGRVTADFFCPEAKLEIDDQARGGLLVKGWHPRGVMRNRSDQPGNWDAWSIFQDPGDRPYVYRRIRELETERPKWRTKVMDRLQLRQARQLALDTLHLIERYEHPLMESLLQKQRRLLDRHEQLRQLAERLTEASGPGANARLEQVRAQLEALRIEQARLAEQLQPMGGSLEGLANRREFFAEQVRKIEVSHYKRWAFALSSLAFALVGVPLAISMRKAHVLAAFAISCLFVFVVFWPLLMVGASLGESGELPPWLAMSIPNLALGIPGFVLSLKLLGRG